LDGAFSGRELLGPALAGNFLLWGGILYAITLI
jgi:hypothetical protein